MAVYTILGSLSLLACANQGIRTLRRGAPLWYLIQGKMAGKTEIKFMTYNVWSREDVAVYKRMKAISLLVSQHSPDVIFFQEMTSYILCIFESFAWWNEYQSSPVYVEEQREKNFCMMLSKHPLEKCARWKFSITQEGRGYLEADITPAGMKPIRIATTQLESPIPPSSMHFRERHLQAKHAIAALSSAENVVFGGDMSWDDNTDLPFPLPAGWVDAWPSWRTTDSWTYDSFWAEQAGDLNGYTAFPMLKKRCDRFVCKLQKYALKTIDLIGDQVLGIKCTKKYAGYAPAHVELMPSCHRGLLVTLVPRESS